LRYGSAAVSNLYYEINNKKNRKKESYNIGGMQFHHFPVNSNFFLNKRIEPKKIIQINDINYKFPNAKKNTIKNLNLSIEVGSIIGIIGGSGAGKTTLVDIILGLLQPLSGSIIVDEIQIDSKNIFEWQKCIGYVPQEMFLIDATILENIAFGIPKHLINREKVIKSAKMAQIHDFITKELPDGYSTKVGERGARISGGQKQRVSIARALFRDSSILIFDEATSALDPVTEKSILKTIRSLTGNKTIIIIAHKLTALKDCDSIILLEQGKIKAKGSMLEIQEIQKDFFV